MPRKITFLFSVAFFYGAESILLLMGALCFEDSQWPHIFILPASSIMLGMTTIITTSFFTHDNDSTFRHHSSCIVWCLRLSIITKIIIEFHNYFKIVSIFIYFSITGRRPVHHNETFHPPGATLKDLSHPRGPHPLAAPKTAGVSFLLLPLPLSPRECCCPFWVVWNCFGWNMQNPRLKQSHQRPFPGNGLPPCIPTNKTQGCGMQ